MRFLQFVLPLIAVSVFGQTTIRQVIEQSLRNYASVQVSQEKVSAAAASIQLARTAYLPKADLFGQWNRASRNNIFGLTLPNQTLPSISGPPRPENDMRSVWGSAVGLLISWEPFDFGLRSANVGVADAAKRREELARKRTEFEVAGTAADAYLTILAAEATAQSAKAGVERAAVLENIVSALTKAELRPGADAARTRAERAAAEAQLIQAETAVATAKASLRQFTGDMSGPLASLSAPPESIVPGNPESHPVAAEQAGAIEEAKAREKVLTKSYVPKFNVVGASYARGTGNDPVDGRPLGGVNGLGPNIFNYAAGVTVSFPAMSLFALRSQRAEEAAKERSEAARYRQVLQNLNAQLDRAKIALEGARRVAKQTPIQRESAQAAEQQATARYKAGLGNISEVADAQRLLVQAETDDALAKLAIWRGLLHVSIAQGDLTPFLNTVGQ